MHLARPCLLQARRILLTHNLPLSRLISNSGVTHETDEWGIPIKPTWSVDELLSSYPTPTISSASLKRLHELSALMPPEEGTPEHTVLKRELEDLVKLVEAVRLVKLDSSSSEGIPDGRIWAEGTGIPLMDSPKDDTGVSGSALLRYAARTSDGMYVVDSDRTK